MSGETPNGVTRRGIVGSIGTGAGVVGLAMASQSHAALLPEPSSRETYDVIVVGSGLSGCVAALEAASRGAKVVVLEKASEANMGGNSLLALGTLALPSEATADARKAFVEDFETLCLGRSNREILTLMANHVHDDIAWLTANDMSVTSPRPRPPTRVANVTVAPGPYAGLPRLFRTMRQRIPAAGGTLVFETKAKQLIMNERGAVVGVRAIGRNGAVDYLGKAVVIATGGYAGNSQLLEGYSDPNAGALMVRGIPRATGDGLVMAQGAGAGLKGMGGMMALHIAAVDPVETGAGQPSGAVPYSLAINRDGKRFVDESRGYVVLGKATLDQPQQTATLVIDQSIRALPAVDAIFGTFKRLNLTIHEANTLEELARKVGAPVAAFVATINEFNNSVKGNTAAGASPPKTALAQRIEKPPFFAFHPLVPGITLTFGGIMINGRAQALEADGRVIPGLYAAGEGAGAVFFHDYIGGGSLTNCLVMGRIAGREAAA